MSPPLQSECYDDIVEVVSNFVRSTNPPLRPALRGRSFETQLSLTDAPPDYDKANKVLKVSHLHRLSESH